MSEDNKEIEAAAQQVIAAAETTQAPIPSDQPANPEDVYAAMFKTYFPYFCNQIDKMTSGHLKLLIKQLIGYPLEISEVKFKDTLHSELFNIGERLMQSKYGMMIIAMEKKNHEEYMKQQAAQTTLTNDPGAINISDVCTTEKPNE